MYFHENHICTPRGPIQDWPVIFGRPPYLMKRYYLRLLRSNAKPPIPNRAITISKGKVFSKYSVYFYDGTCLTLNCNADSPQGLSRWTEYYGSSILINDTSMALNIIVPFPPIFVPLVPRPPSIFPSSTLMLIVTESRCMLSLSIISPCKSPSIR